MTTRRAIRGVLGNFLGTYVSRYTAYDGYWLFGFMVSDIGKLQFDLLAPIVSAVDSPLGVAAQTAADKFGDQVRKAGLTQSQIQEAFLTIRKQPVSVEGSVNGIARVGNNVSFSAEVVMDSGRRYQREQVVFVAPHDDGIESQSTRAI